MQKKLIKNYSNAELSDIICPLGFEKYRSGQILQEILVNRKNDFNEISNIPSKLKDFLSNNFTINSFKDYSVADSIDGSKKILFQLYDDNSIETVFMPSSIGAEEQEIEDNNSIKVKDRISLCISTMSGCPVACPFCATGNIGYHRNLEAAEIIDQILITEKITNSKINNIVIMGMGEPLLNTDNVMKFLSIITDKKYNLFNAKRITLSTVGVISGINKLMELDNPIKLAISLHSTIDKIRETLIPLNKKYNIKSILETVEEYYKKTKLPITFEYLLLDGINDNEIEANRLIKISRRFPSMINLINYNSIKNNSDSIYRKASETKLNQFYNILKNNSVNVFVRKSYGNDIAAACGQLASNYKQINNK